MPSLPRTPAERVQRSARWLTFSMLALMAFGLVMVASASAVQELAANGRLATLAAHLVKTAAALAAFLLALRVSPLRLRAAAGPAWLACVALLVAVLVVGVEVKGARRWLDLGMLRLQPSELARLATILAIGAWGSLRAEQMHRLLPGVVIPFLLAAVPAVLVLLEPDFGSSVYLLFMAFLVLLVAGARPRHVLGVFLAGLALTSLYGWERIGHVSRRLAGFLDPEPGSQVWQSLVALGHGGLGGVGLGQGLSKWGYVPEAENDFILAVVGEELGLLGTLGLLALYALFLWHGVVLLLGLRSRFALVVGAGLLFQVLVQALLNVAVVTGVAPPKGLPLPFVSAGGTSALVLALSTGLLLGLAARAEEDGELDVRRVPAMLPPGS